jgi:hypothetical protein
VTIVHQKCCLKAGFKKVVRVIVKKIDSVLKQQGEVQKHDTVGKADETLVEEAKRHEKLRRPKCSAAGTGHGPDQLQMTSGGMTEPCVMGGTTKVSGD